MSTEQPTWRYFFVCLEPGLNVSRQNALMAAIKLHPGVLYVQDAEFAGLPEGWRAAHEGTAEPKRRRGKPAA